MNWGGKEVDEVTDFSSICNLTARRYGYRTFGDPTPYVIDLTTTDFTGDPRTAALPEKGHFPPATVEEVTARRPPATTCRGAAARQHASSGPVLE